MNLSDHPKFRLKEINKIKDYFSSEIQERKTTSKKLSKYIAAFDYIDKTLIVLSSTSGSAIKIVMLAKSKLNSIETLMSQALADLDISH